MMTARCTAESLVTGVHGGKGGSVGIGGNTVTIFSVTRTMIFGGWVVQLHCTADDFVARCEHW